MGCRCSSIGVGLVAAGWLEMGWHGKDGRLGSMRWKTSGSVTRLGEVEGGRPLGLREAFAWYAENCVSKSSDFSKE